MVQASVEGNEASFTHSESLSHSLLLSTTTTATTTTTDSAALSSSSPALHSRCCLDTVDESARCLCMRICLTAQADA